MKFVLLAVWGAFFALPLHAQSFVQIESHRSLADAQSRAQFYASRLPDVNGFRANTGWYAIALGPYPEEEAERRLASLVASRQVPRDAFISDGQPYLDPFLQATAPAPLEPLKPSDETEADARASEATLDRPAREDIQTALEWFGHYNAAIDGSFGPGTRRSMASWQAAQNYEATGVLTTGQRAELMGSYRAALARIDLETITDREAGIEMMIPSGLVTFADYETPFARYAETADSGTEVLLISQEGDEETLFALYEVMQTLDIIPEQGERTRRERDFVLTGENDERHTYAQAELNSGTIKGFLITYPADEAAQMSRITDLMRESFIVTDGVLGPQHFDASAQSVERVAGLDIRRPNSSASGFYVSDAGIVLTHPNNVANCERVTLDGAEAQITQTNQNVAIITPDEPIAPLAYADLAEAPPRLRSDLAVAGYSFDGRLDAATIAYGTLGDIEGLRGEDGSYRLDIAVLPGDAGGPVLDGAGLVVGMLAPHPDMGKNLPDGVGFAVASDVLRDALASVDLPLSPRRVTEPMDPERLERHARDMTALVSCW